MTKFQKSKKAFAGLTCLLFVLTVLYPTGVFLSACFGYQFEPVSFTAFAVLIAVLSVCSVALDLTFRIRQVAKATQILWAIITPLSLVNAVFLILGYSRNWIIASALLSAGCCFFLAVEHGKPLVLKIVALALTGLMVLPIGYLSFFAMLLVNFVKNTVVKTVESPSGKYYAQVIDSDQGALGGDTQVKVYENKNINLLLFKIEKKPQSVYFGDWGEFRTMQIYWAGEGCLIINSVSHYIEMP